MVEEETQKGRKEAREKVVVELEEMIEKGYGNVTFGSEGIRQGECIERRKGRIGKGNLVIVERQHRNGAQRGNRSGWGKH